MSLGRISTVIAILFVAGTIFIIQWPISSVLPEATDNAKSIDWIFKYMLIAGWLVFLIVQGFLLAFVLKYRHRPEDPPDKLGDQIHGNTRLELVWTIIPTIFLISLSIISFKVYMQIIATPAHAYTIDATGFQFGWECDHPAYHITEIGTCHMPVNQEITIQLHSRDVIHSFWVPAFRVKEDAVPGLHNVMHFKTEEVGTYPLICAELCGSGHAEMRATVYVMPQAAFKQWVASQEQANSGTSSLANVSFKSNIETLFSQHCAVCHIDQQLGNLNLGTYQGLLKGGSIVPGSIVVAGNHQKSLLWHMISATGPWPGGNRMPLGGPYLSQSDINTIAAWIDQGAKNN
jgi:cytochrome c oxidase subunit 2